MNCVFRVRYDITHPVVNDDEGVMWNDLGISCWPTQVVIGNNDSADSALYL